MTANERVAILMCTKDGESYIEKQLQSILEQDHEAWSLWVSDDGSKDKTLDILKAFQADNPAKQIEIVKGPQCGFSRNFLSLMANQNIKADYYALSDQDDIWRPNRLSHGIEMLKKSGAALYGGRTIYIDETDKDIGISPLFKRPPSLQNALVQSIAGGNTMLFTDEAMTHIRKTPMVDVPAQDWWLYILLSASGFKVYYDEVPVVLYRQHTENAIGSNSGLRAKYDRVKRLKRGEFKAWNELHITALRSSEHLLSPEGAKVLREWEQLRRLRGISALRKLRDIGLYRQTVSGEIALRVASMIGKI